MGAKTIALKLVRGQSSSEETPSEEELVAGLQEGDPAAREVLYRRHAKDVWRILQRVLGYDSELADVHHEVFVQALRSLPKFEQRSSLKTWLRAVTVRVARAHLRARSRRRWLKLMAPGQLPDLPGTHPEAPEPLMVRAVYEVVAGLSANLRIAFTLRNFDRLSLAEVAELTDVSIGPVKRRLASANERFFKGAARHPALADRVAARRRRTQKKNKEDRNE